MKNKDFDYGTFVTSDNTEHKNKYLNKTEEEFKCSDIDFIDAEDSVENQKIALKIHKAALKVHKKERKAQTRQDKKEKKRIKNQNEEVFLATKTRFSIGFKLISIITVMFVVSLGLVISLVSYFVSGDTKISAEENNLTINSRTASDVQNRFSSVLNSVEMLYDVVYAAGEDEEQIKTTASMFFNHSKDIISVSFLEENQLFTNRQFINSRGIDVELINAFIQQESDTVEQLKNGVTKVVNATPVFGTPITGIFNQILTQNGTSSVLVLFDSEQLTDSFSTGSTNLSYLVNGEGEVLIHPDFSLMNNASDFSNKFLVKKMMENAQSNEQLTFTDQDVSYIGAYNRISIGNCAVITEVQLAVVLEGVNRTTRRNIYLTIAILAFVIIIIYFFSKSMSRPLKKLTAVANEINDGNFDTELFQSLKDRRSDEIGVLISSTKNEQQILNTVTRLTNKGVTKAIVRKEIDFDPHLKDITIFFSDIRGFTAISDGFNNRFGDKSAGEIIGFLNDYMGRMVNCITLTGGNVDKFEGDAIMACWGVLRDDDLSFEKMPDDDPQKAELTKIHADHVKADAVSAIKATIAMRYSLMEYNKQAELFTKEHQHEPMAKYKPHIRIGSGLNSGRATVGFMGSYDKMEFTSIGDAVNLASRTESSNKPCGTDMLITQDTYDLLKDDFIRNESNNFTISPENEKNEVVVEMIPVTFEVKGKGKQHFYGVVNMPNFDIEEFFRQGNPEFTIDEDCEKAVGPKGPKSLAEVRTLLGIPTPDFEKVNLDAEENKVTAS